MYAAYNQLYCSNFIMPNLIKRNEFNKVIDFNQSEACILEITTI